MGKNTSIYIDQTLWEQLNELAQKLNRSRNETVGMLLEQSLEKALRIAETGEITWLQTNN